MSKDDRNINPIGPGPVKPSVPDSTECHALPPARQGAGGNFYATSSLRVRGCDMMVFELTRAAGEGRPTGFESPRDPCPAVSWAFPLALDASGDGLGNGPAV